MRLPAVLQHPRAPLRALPTFSGAARANDGVRLRTQKMSSDAAKNQIVRLSAPARQSALPPTAVDGGHGGGGNNDPVPSGGDGGGDGSGDQGHEPGLLLVLAALAAGLAGQLMGLASAMAAEPDTKSFQQQQPAGPAAGLEPSSALVEQAVASSQVDAAADSGSDPAGSPAALPSDESPPDGPPPRRIALFIEPSPFTYVCGYMTRYQATIRHLVEAGCEVLVVTPAKCVGPPGADHGGAEQPAAFEGAKVLGIAAFQCPWYGAVPLSLGLSPRIFNAVRDFGPEIIHCTSPGPLPLAAWAYSRLLRVPLVCSYHTHVPAYLPRLGLSWLTNGVWAGIRWIHRAADLTISVSPSTGEELARQGCAEPRRIKVWRKAVDCEAFSPQAASPSMRARLSGGDLQAPLLLYVGRVSHEKNIVFLRGVLARVPGARLAVVGDGPAMADVKRQLAGTPSTFLGLLRGKELAQAYASADVFVMPSESETLGNVVSEAMASGTPVVAVRAGGIPSIINDPGRVGLMYEPGDVEAAAHHVRRLLQDQALRHSMAAAARAEIERYSWKEATLEILRSFYPAARRLQRQRLRSEAQSAAEWDNMLRAVAA